MTRSARNKKTIHSYPTKKCPECREILRLDAQICTGCNKKVGNVNKYGYAEKPVDWRGYASCLLSWLALACYMWWAFIR